MIATACWRRRVRCRQCEIFAEIIETACWRRRVRFLRRESFADTIATVCWRRRDRVRACTKIRHYFAKIRHYFANSTSITGGSNGLSGFVVTEVESWPYRLSAVFRSAAFRTRNDPLVYPPSLDGLAVKRWNAESSLDRSVTTNRSSAVKLRSASTR